MKLLKNQRGIGAIEIVLIVVALGIVGFVGWKVWGAREQVNNQKLVDSKPETHKKEDTKNTDALKSEIAKIDVSLRAQGKVCQGASVDFTPDETKFTVVSKNDPANDNRPKITDDFSYAIVNHGCGGSTGGVGALLKQEDGKWVVIAESAQYFECADVDGHGVPDSIDNTCWDGPDNTRPIEP